MPAFDRTMRSVEKGKLVLFLQILHLLSTLQFRRFPTGSDRTSQVRQYPLALRQVSCHLCDQQLLEAVLSPIDGTAVACSTVFISSAFKSAFSSSRFWHQWCSCLGGGPCAGSGECLCAGIYPTFACVQPIAYRGLCGWLGLAAKQSRDRGISRTCLAARGAAGGVGRAVADTRSGLACHGSGGSRHHGDG